MELFKRISFFTILGSFAIYVALDRLESRPQEQPFKYIAWPADIKTISTNPDSAASFVMVRSADGDSLFIETMDR